MRPNHQNKRMRGRNRGGGGGGGGGKGPNPLTRSYESNGPDVKIRGTAHHIAEKYLQLGRDAQASGDHVNAENYFQHAEHYLRIIAAANEQMRLTNPNFRPYEIAGQDADDDEDEAGVFSADAPQPEVRFPAVVTGDEEQPEVPARAFPQREGRDFQPRNRDRDFQGRNREFQPREGREPRPPREGGEVQPREQREFQPRGEGEERAPREGRFNRFERRGPRPDRAPPAEGAEQPGLPAFITAPVRTQAADAPEGVPAEAPQTVAGEGEGFPVKERRRRGRPRKSEAEAPAGVDDAGE